ncbi:hypothetical protein AMTR_s00052p00157930 [Amborella trichopoda]|uniref:Uncharacterized protein n=1 Tax=Amborella trichopoda TaxID=13333 RepID=U5D4S1_AMBTC|nr:hypothetical protein AMTR_s00052p00157930 [Amborella trichopoda]
MVLMCLALPVSVGSQRPIKDTAPNKKAKNYYWSPNEDVVLERADQIVRPPITPDEGGDDVATELHEEIADAMWERYRNRVQDPIVVIILYS